MEGNRTGWPLESDDARRMESRLEEIVLIMMHVIFGKFRYSQMQSSSSLSAGSSTRSCNGDLVRFAGESGVVARDELELGHLLWLRFEKVEVMGDEEVDAPDESRECAGVK